MQNVLRTEGAGAPPADTRATGLAARSGTSSPPRTPGQRWRAFALLVVAYFITIVDFTIVNVALPIIGRTLRFPESDLQWVEPAATSDRGSSPVAQEPRRWPSPHPD